MATADCYYEVERKSTISSELLDFAMQPSEWMDYYNFKAKLVPPDLLFKDRFFAWLLTKHNFIAGILKLDPYVCYDWHTDTRRGVGINMLLTPFNRSICAFAPDKHGMVFDIEELKYKPMTYYLFNTQVNHTVYNFETTRYILSIEFEEDLDALSFEELVNEVKEHEKNSTK